MRIRLLRVVMLGLLLRHASAAADCGPAPVSEAYSTNFYRAQAKYFHDSFHQESGGSTNFPVPVGPAVFQVGVSGNHNSGSEQTGWETITTEEAYNYIRQEHQDKGAQIVDECAYRMCTLLEGATSASALPETLLYRAVEFQERVCLGFSSNPTLAPGDQPNHFVAAAPSVREIRFEDYSPDSVTQTVDIVHRSFENATIKVEVTVEDGTLAVEPLITVLKHGKPLKPGKTLRFTLKPYQTVPITFQVKKPSSPYTQRPKLIIKQVDNAQNYGVMQLLIAPPAAPLEASIASLVKTGETIAYAPYDDGQLQIGANANFVDNGDGTISDTNLGLMWEKKTNGGTLHYAGNSYTWGTGAGGIFQWIQDVNAEGGTGFAGYNDWRIPNIRELSSLTNYAAWPTVFPPFHGACQDALCSTGCDGIGDCMIGDIFWSSSTVNLTPSDAWTVYFARGTIAEYDKASSHWKVRAVRGGN